MLKVPANTFRCSLDKENGVLRIRPDKPMYLDLNINCKTGCIRVNVLNGTNIWMHPNWEVLNEMKNFLEEIGLGFLF